jgi:hypothetical protein
MKLKQATGVLRGVGTAEAGWGAEEKVHAETRREDTDRRRTDPFFDRMDGMDGIALMLISKSLPGSKASGG